MTRPIVMIAGASGLQGGAVARRLLAAGEHHVRALTRNPDSPAAQSLAEAGAEIVPGDLNDPASVARAVAGAWGVFSVQNAILAGLAGEEVQGRRLATIAREHGVEHFVYTSIGSAEQPIGVPFFESKARVEQAVRELGFPSYVILRPTFFMENLISPIFFSGNEISGVLDPQTSVAMVAADDIGRYGALAFTEPMRCAGDVITIAGDLITMPQAAAELSSAVARPISYRYVPPAEFEIPALSLHPEGAELFAGYGRMFGWLDEVGYTVDIEANKARYGIDPTSLSRWAHTMAKSVVAAQLSTRED